MGPSVCVQSVAIPQKGCVGICHGHQHQVWSEDDARLFEILILSVMTDISDIYNRKISHIF